MATQEYKVIDGKIYKEIEDLVKNWLYHAEELQPYEDLSKRIYQLVDKYRS